MRLLLETTPKNSNEDSGLRAISYEVDDAFFERLRLMAALCADHELSEVRRYYHPHEKVEGRDCGRLEVVELCVSQSDMWFEGVEGDCYVNTPPLELSRLFAAVEGDCETLVVYWGDGSDVEALLECAGISVAAEDFGSKLVALSMAGEYRREPMRDELMRG